MIGSCHKPIPCGTCNLEVTDHQAGDLVKVGAAQADWLVADRSADSSGLTHADIGI